MAARTAAELRVRLAAREAVFGIFVKTASHQVFELLGGTGVDFAIIDAEHAPFDRNALDICLMAARAAGIPCIVRVPELSEAAVLAPLDMGATGVMVPRIADRRSAEMAVQLARYRGGRRGYSNSPRAGRYGRRAMAEHISRSDADTVVIAMIEDTLGIERLDEIAQVDGIRALFLGQADLTVAMGLDDPAHEQVRAAVDRFLDRGSSTGVPLGAMSSNPVEIADLGKRGVRFFVVGTDQGLFRAAVDAALARSREALR